MLKKILKLAIILAISVLVGNMAYGIYKENSVGDGPSSHLLDNTEKDDSTKKQEQQNKYGKSEAYATRVILPEKYKSYNVIARLEIPKIELETYVFEEYSEEAMWICPTKYYGPNPNEIGNLCIAAHNYNKPNMFNHIIELAKGDTIFLSDNKNGKNKYIVYDIYKSNPDNTSSLSQDTNGETDITLITCSDYSSKRIIVKARKI